MEIFGEIIDSRGLDWAIRENILCDYVVQTIVSDTDTVDYHASRFNITTPNDKRLFLSAFSALKSISIGDSHHLLIYANDTPNTRKIVEYVNRMLASKCFFTNSTRFGTTSTLTSADIYCSVYTSELSTIVQQTTLERFEQSPFGILVCVYCLGEGWDLPLLDGVVFAENMTSTIRIVQSALRPCRKNMNEPHKRSKIILPIYDPTNELMTTSTTPCQSEDMMKIKTVIGQLSREDADILHRIQTFRMSIESDTSNPVGIASKSVENSIGILDASLTERLNLKTTTRYDFVMQYHKAKQLLTRKGLKSRKEYAELCEKDNRFPPVPMDKDAFGDKFKGWIDYLGIDKTKYYTLDQCKLHVRTYISNNSIQISPLNVTNVCNDVHHSNKSRIPSPDLWEDVYNIKLEDIAVTPRIAKKWTRKL